MMPETINNKLWHDFSVRRWINFLSLWITYVAFYTARQNLSVAQPAIEVDLGWSKTDLGLISTCFAVAYAIGQVVNGQVADKLGGKRLYLIGISVVVLANLFFSMTSSLIVMSVLWTFNGFFLATGVPSNARINANWYTVSERGRYLGLFSTCGQVGAVTGLLLAGAIISVFDWRYTFIAPCIVLFIIGIQVFFILKDSPQDAGFPSISEVRSQNSEIKSQMLEISKPAGFRYTIKFILTSKPILIMALTYLLLGIIKNGLITWIPTYIAEEHKASFDSSAYKSIMLPLIGSFGCIFAGWVSDRLFDARRAPICVILLVLLMGFLFVFRIVTASDVTLSLLFLGLSGFALFGPYTLITTIAALDFGGEKAAASASGFIDGMAYVGMALAGIGLGWIIDNFGWDGCFVIWIISAFLGAMLMATMWKKKA